MKLTLAMSLIAAWLSSGGSVHAQFKFADLTPRAEGDLKSTDSRFLDVKERADLKHGTVVAATRNDGSKVTGHVVRFDSKNNRLLVRTKAGQPPMVFQEQDIKKLQKAVREVGTGVPTARSALSWRDLPNGLQENDNGVLRIKPRGWTAGQPATFRPGSVEQIKPAMDQPKTRWQNIVEPEIFKQVIYNGTQRSVAYSSDVISPVEREALVQFQNAENNLMALVDQKDLRDTAINQELAMQDARVRTQNRVNQTMINENMSNYPYPEISFTSPWGGWGHSGGGWGLATSAPNTKGVVTILPQVIPPATGLIDRLAPVDPKMIADAQAALGRLQAQMVYEDGRLVAVGAKEGTVK